jgi:hypothetical protein
MLDSALEAIRDATDFLPKPIDRSRLKRTLDEVAAVESEVRSVLERSAFDFRLLHFRL